MSVSSLPSRSRLSAAALWALALACAVVSASAWTGFRAERADLLQRRLTVEANFAAWRMETAAGSAEERAARALGADPVVTPSFPSAPFRRIVSARPPVLLASDRPEDGAPRRLKREEKALFDLARKVGVNLKENAKIPDKPDEHLDILPLDAEGGLPRVAAPFLIDGKFSGAAMATAPPTGGVETEGGFWPKAAGIFGTALLLALLALRILVRRESASAGGAALFAVLFAAGLCAAIYLSIGAAQSQAGEGRAEFAAFLSDAGKSAKTLAPSGVPVPDPAEWDANAKGIPRGEFARSGDGEIVRLRAGELPAGFPDSVFPAWLAAMIVFAFVAAGGAAAVRRAWRENRPAYLYIAPAMIGMLALVFFPFAYGVALSFTNTTLFNESAPFAERWVGLRNYFDILGDIYFMRLSPEGWSVNYDSFYWTLFITVCWTVFNVAIGASVGLGLALLLNQDGLRGRAFYRVILILPWATPNLITALIWKGMFHRQFGAVNQAIQAFGGEPVAWFGGVFTSFLTGLAANGWMSFPFMMVVSLGALQSIPRDMYEAADLEGASRWRRFRSITLPLLRPALVPAVIISVVWTFNMFNVIFLVSAGEPSGANEILITKAYKIGFEKYQYAYAAAYSVVIFFILLAYGVMQNRVSRATEGAMR